MFSHLNDKLRAVEGIEFKTASKIYVAGNSELNSEFSAVTRDVFNSEVENVNFTTNTETAKEINSWVNSSTLLLITDNADV